MAIVYEVTDPESTRPLAAKVLLARGAGAARFGREYRALTRIDHPNVVRVFRYGLNDAGLPYLVMELLRGESAQAYVKHLGRPGDPVRTAEAIRVASCVAEALDCLHARGIVHRDLKSSNIVVLPGGGVKLLDFGTARMEDQRDALTEPGEFVGTFHYASPEQLTGAALDGRSDLYALGVLLFRMLTGRRPFDGDDPVTLARQHLEGEPASVASLARGVPPAVVELVARLLAKSPGARPSRAAEVVEFLLPFLVGPPLSAVDPGAALRFVGRHGQVNAVRRLFDEASPGAGLVFCGPEGAGRGRLVGFAVNEATRRGCRSLRVLASGTARPFGPLCTQLGAGLLLDGDPEGASWARAALTPDGVHTPSFAAALAARARLDGRTLLLAVEGMEDADPADVCTLAATMIALAEIGGAVLMVGAWGEEAMPATWLGLHLVDVPPLTGLEIGVVASHWLGVSAVAPELVRRLSAASGGMPAPLEGLVRQLPRESRGRLTLPPGKPPGNEALHMQIESLAPLERRVLDAVSLAEGDLDNDALSTALALPVGLVREALMELSRERIIQPLGRGWGFRQGVTADFVRDRIRPTRRAVLCRLIARAFVEPPASPRLALLLVDAGQPEAAARCAVAWARPLMDAGMHAEVRAGLERIVHGRGDTPAQFDLWLVYAECLAVLRGESMQTDQALSQAQALAVGPAEEGQLALVSASMAQARADTPGQRAALVRAVELFRHAGGPGYTDVGVEALLRLSELLVHVGELDVAWRLAREGADARERAPGAPGLGRAHYVLAEVELARGELVSAERLLRDAVARDGADWRAIGALSTTMRFQGRLSEARRLLDEALARARVAAPAGMLASLLLAAAEVDIDLFRAGLARERLAQAVDALGGSVPVPLDAAVARLRARLFGMAGEAAGALRLVEPALERADARGWRLSAAELTAERAVLLTALGRHGEAMVATAAASRTFVRMGALLPLAELFVAAVDRGEAVDPQVRGELEPWSERQPARVARLALLTDDTRGAQIEGGLDPEIARNKAHTLLRQLTQMQLAEDRASFLLHPRRQNLRGTGGR